MASYIVRLVCRLGGCGPAVVMRTGPHLGGGPAPLGPAPTLPVDPCGRVFGHCQRPQGFLMPAGSPRGPGRNVREFVGVVMGTVSCAWRRAGLLVCRSMVERYHRVT